MYREPNKPTRSKIKPLDCTITYNTSENYMQVTSCLVACLFMILEAVKQQIKGTLFIPVLDKLPK